MKKLSTGLGAILIACLLISIDVYAATAGVPNYVKAEVIGKFQDFIKEYNVLLNGVWAFFMVSSVLIFIVHFIKLGQWSNYPVVRQKIMGDLLVTGICTGLLGSFGLVYYLITRMFL